MQKHLLRQLVVTAFSTAPLIGLIFVTPVYILIGYRYFNFFVPWFGITTAVLLNWGINLALLVKIDKPWTKTWLRSLACSVFLIVVTEILFELSGITLPIENYKVSFLRSINLLAISTIIYILIDLTTTKENKNKVELENAQLHLANLEAEFKLLKDQINPHFLFNALSTAKSLIKKEPALAEEYIVRLSEFLRASINNNRKTVSLKEEIGLCRDFIDLNRIRFGDAIQVDFNLDPVSEELSLPYFALLSLLENAIKHNAFTLESPLRIEVKSTLNQVSVKNNRKSKFNLGISSKTGLHNLEERYKLLTGNGIQVEETDEWFQVTLSLLTK